MNKIIFGLCFIFCIYLSQHASFADSVDVFIPQREVTMHSSDMAKNFENAAKKFKQSYSGDSSSTGVQNNTQSPGAYTYTYTTQPQKKINETKQRQYTSEWT